MTPSRVMILAAAVLAVAGALVWTVWRPTGGAAPPPEPESDARMPVRGTAAAIDAAFVGRPACATCHAEQHDRWIGSHHDLAMQRATEDTVLGDFADATFTHAGVTTTFSRAGERFVVRTDGADGVLHDHEITHAFGVDPLQQYLVGFPDGRYQALPIAWDTRPAAAGGQRWFHLYPRETIPGGDVLHWTGPNQNWNFMCAECHSTDLRKNFDLERGRYDTAWSEIDVSCEACHGPGAAHVAWAERAATTAETPSGDLGLEVTLRDVPPVPWIMDPETGTARRASPPAHGQVEACARCHARRRPTATYAYGRPLADTHRLSLLDEPLYEADGQIREEVYVYGSFIQSRMHAAGVACTDCHDAHTTRPYAAGNLLCARCHDPVRFDAPAHHHHPAGSSGASCVECHMPARTYMVIDPRRDHSLRVPRPDLSVTIGTPNACTGCHDDRTDAWAAASVAGWFPDGRHTRPHYGEALHAGRTGAPGAAAALARLARDRDQPAIARATALSMLTRYPSGAALAAAATELHDRDPLVRAAAVGAHAMLSPPDRLARIFPLLDDPVASVRLEAARMLAPALASAPPEQRDAIRRGVDAAIAAEMVNADRAESHLNIGLLQTDVGDLEAAEASYRTAMRLDPSRVEAHVNLADLYRLLGRDAEGAVVLRDGLRVAPDEPVLHYALGLLHVRRNDLPAAAAALAEAARLGPHRREYREAYDTVRDALRERGGG